MMTAGCHTRARALAGATWLLLAGLRLTSAHAAEVASPLLADPRLASVRAPLEEILARAARDGLPADLIASKVREGLAKGVDPEAIRGAAERLAGSLDGAARFLRAQRGPRSAPGPAPQLIRAVAEANLAGVEAEGLQPLVASSEGDAVVARAIEVVTDLTMRGYPSRRSGAVVRDIADRDPRSLGRVVAGVESIRAEQTVSRADALEALGRNFKTGTPSLDTAVARALEGGDRAGNASGLSPGKSAEAPGHTGNTGASKIKKPKK